MCGSGQRTITWLLTVWDSASIISCMLCKVRLAAFLKPLMQKQDSSTTSWAYLLNGDFRCIFWRVWAYVFRKIWQYVFRESCVFGSKAMFNDDIFSSQILSSIQGLWPWKDLDASLQCGRGLFRLLTDPAGFLLQHHQPVQGSLLLQTGEVWL